MDEVSPIPPDAATAWGVLGRHGMRLYDRPTFTGWASDHAFALLTGEPNLDSNICSLHGAATADDARTLLEVIDRVGVPAVIPVSASVADSATEPLREAGFTPLEREVAMWRPAEPIPARPHPFDVRAVHSAADVAAASRVVTAAHGTAPGLVERSFNIEALRDGDVRSYIAWDGDEAAATGWVVTGEGWASVHEMMTAPAHRRRGAGRAVLEQSMADVAAVAPAGTLLWASPLGRPLYASVGFVVFDEITPWVRGGTAAELAAIGASLV